LVFSGNGNWDEVMGMGVDENRSRIHRYTLNQSRRILQSCAHISFRSRCVLSRRHLSVNGSTGGGGARRRTCLTGNRTLSDGELGLVLTASTRRRPRRRFTDRSNRFAQPFIVTDSQKATIRVPLAVVSNIYTVVFIVCTLLTRCQPCHCF